jgi:2-oxoglutarate ferredoxin oxidoreductase subunit alpha
LTYKSFYLAHKWRNPVILLADGLLGQMMEPVEFGEYPYPEVDNSDWALTGAKDRASRAIRSLEVDMEAQARHVEHLFEKYKQFEAEYEEFMCEDADLIITCFGSVARNVKSAVKQCREEGLKVGMFRPITLFPFPSARLGELTPKMFLDIEVNMGQMLRDVRLGVNGRVPVEFFGKPVGVPPPVEDIIEEIKKWL